MTRRRWAESAGGPASDDELVAAAAAGDMDAAGAFLARHHDLLSSLARRVAKTTIDHEELLSEVTLHLLEKWTRGSGPREAVIAYLVRSMRNRLIDELRSPRSQVQTMEDLVHAAHLVVLDDVSHIDFESEAEVIRRALALLSFDQRATLIGMTVEGRKPADIAPALGRTPQAVSNLFQRSRTALRRATLVVMLSDGDEPCAANAGRIPKNPHADLRRHGREERGMLHVRHCRECSARWRRWAQGSLGLRVPAALRRAA